MCRHGYLHDPEDVVHLRSGLSEGGWQALLLLRKLAFPQAVILVSRFELLNLLTICCEIYAEVKERSHWP